MATKKCREYSGSYTFDEAISETGYGRFHYKVFSVCALNILCVGFQNGLTSYVFSAAQCDLGFKSQDLGLLNVAFMLGGTISAFFWGIIADVKGRRNILVWTILLDATTTLGCSFTQSFSGLMICRFLNGVLIGCGGSVTYIYLAEFHSPKLQAKSVCYSGIAFIAGWVLLPVMAYTILPLNFKIDILDVPYTPWRVFLIVVAVPEFLSGLCLLKLPESPKFLYDKHRNEKALKILNNIYCQNMSKENQGFSVKKLSHDSIIQKDVKNLQQCRGKKARLLRDMVTQTKQLFSPDIWTKTLLMCLIMFSNMFGYFGMGLWLPEFFIRFEKHYQLNPNISVTLKELTFTENSNSTTICPVAFDLNIFQNTLIVAASALVVNTLGGWLIGKISVKNLALLTMIFGGISSLSIYWISSSLGILIVSSIFQSSMATGNMVIGSIVVELFPTSIGAMAMCITVTTGRIGAIASNMVFSMLLGEDIGTVIIIVSVVLLLGAVLCILVPLNMNKEKDIMQETSINSSKCTVDIAVISLGEHTNRTFESD
ncbi:membrane transporter [Oryctes borbonicus]|uniref:Membrane transporter n=1 Tax=Oryctes borbonicus TaxID=1629725 RepID=A0A0T6B5Y4_9SCAR|nr:membrane transporter [Oryctes borbonicus]